jgi:methylase of polypeptide subunit release factors
MEHRQRDSLDIYAKFFQAAASWLKPGGRLIMNVGRTKKWNMADELMPHAQEWFRLVHAFDESVAGRESFGISDQGSTSTHQYLFFTLR